MTREQYRRLRTRRSGQQRALAAVQFSQLRTLRDYSGRVAIAQAIQPSTRGFGLKILHESEGAHVHAHALQNTLQKAAVHYGNVDFSVTPHAGCR